MTDQSQLTFPSVSTKKLPRPFCFGGIEGAFPSRSVLVAFSTQLIWNKKTPVDFGLPAIWGELLWCAQLGILPLCLGFLSLGKSHLHFASLHLIVESGLLDSTHLFVVSFASRQSRFGSRVSHPGMYNWEIPSPPLRFSSGISQFVLYLFRIPYWRGEQLQDLYPICEPVCLHLLVWPFEFEICKAQCMYLRLGQERVLNLLSCVST